MSSRRLAVALAVLGLPVLAAAEGTPDLRLDVGTLASSVTYDLLFVEPGACELQPADLCVGAPGARKVLRFDTFAVNDGDGDLVVGVPDPEELLPNGDPKWVWSGCHGHYHFESFARYELRRRGETATLIDGFKRAFCVEDTKPDTATTPRRYCCAVGVTCELTGTQGLQPGWGDLYSSNLPCQWIDITDLPDDQTPVDVDLCVFLNFLGVLPDADPTNDVGCAPLTIAGPLAGARAPKVKVRKPKPKVRAAVGRPLKVAWRKRAPGLFKFQEVWFSADDGLSWRLLAGGPALPKKRSSFKWLVPSDAATTSGRVKVVVWTKNPPDDPGPGSFQRATAISEPFAIAGE